MRTLAVAADLLLAVHAHAYVGLLRAHTTSLHHLTTGRVRQLACDLYVELQEALQCHVGGEPLHSLVGDAVLRPALGTFYLRAYVIRSISLVYRIHNIRKVFSYLFKNIKYDNKFY